MSCLKPNYIGIVGGILAFISLALPWWTLSMSTTGVPISVDVSVYLYQVTTAGLTVTMELWYAWAALAFVIIGGLLGIVGSVTALGRKLLIAGGVLALLSIIIFAAGLQNELSKIPVTGIGLFSSGSYSYMGVSLNYSTYLSFGFWLALVAAIIMFVASRKKPAPIVPTPPPPSVPT